MTDFDDTIFTCVWRSCELKGQPTGEPLVS
jgi:hypothetical protein